MRAYWQILSASLALVFLSGPTLGSEDGGPSEPKSHALPIVQAGSPVQCDRGIACGAGLTLRSTARSTHHTNRAPIESDGEWITFSLPGVYEFDVAGNPMAYIAIGTSAKRNADVAHAFATQASDGSSRDHNEFDAAREQLVQGLFLRHDKVGLACGMTAQMMGMLLDEMGIAHRLVNWIGPDPNDGAHQSLEVALPGSGWTLYDPHYGVAFTPGTTALDVFDLSVREQPVGPYVGQFFRKASWLEHPWRAYERYSLAVGHFDAGRIVMLVAEGADCCAPEHSKSWKLERVTRNDFVERYYSNQQPRERTSDVRASR